jgi:hypothetical protein
VLLLRLLLLLRLRLRPWLLLHLWLGRRLGGPLVLQLGLLLLHLRLHLWLRLRRPLELRLGLPGRRGLQVLWRRRLPLVLLLLELLLPLALLVLLVRCRRGDRSSPVVWV